MTNVVPPPDTAVYVSVPIVSKGAFVIVGWARGDMKLVCPSMTKAVAPAASEIVVPDTTIKPPSVSNADPIM